jgi:hypothetical protein
LFNRLKILGLSPCKIIAVSALNPPVCLGVCHGCPIHVDMVIIIETEELLAGELHAVVGDDGVWDPEAMNNVAKEEHHLLRLDLCDWLSLNPL